MISEQSRWVSATADCYTTLNQTIVDLWRISLDRAPYTQWLSEDELTRLHRYRFEKDRRKFAIARSSLRQILGQYLQTNPEDIVFDYSPRGKPAVTNNQGIEFNLSHSGDYALCAVAQTVVGVDIEQLRSIDRLEGMTKRCLTHKEQAALRRQPAPEHSTAFLKYWTCKEAYLKATGQGISESLTTIEVELAPTAKLKVPGPDWQLKVLSPCPGYTGAVAMSPTITQIRFWHFEH